MFCLGGKLLGLLGGSLACARFVRDSLNHNWRLDHVVTGAVHGVDASAGVDQINLVLRASEITDGPGVCFIF